MSKTVEVFKHLEKMSPEEMNLSLSEINLCKDVVSRLLRHVPAYMREGVVQQLELYQYLIEIHEERSQDASSEELRSEETS